MSVFPSFAEARDRLIHDNEIPSLPPSWDVQRFRFLFRESKERNGDQPVGDMLSVSEYSGVIPREYDNEEQRRTDDELSNYRVVRKGQLAVNTMWLNHLGLGVSEHLGHVSPAYAVYDISPKLEYRFVHHLLRSQYYLNIYLRYLYGIRPNSFQVKTDDWNSIPIIVPPLAVQKSIADFLDRETARIDQLIEKKQRLIDMLVLSHGAATLRIMRTGFEGLDYDSSSNTLSFSGMAPRWQRLKVKHVVSHMTSGSRGWGDQIQDDGELFLQSGCITSKMEVSLEDAQRIAPQQGAEADRTRVRPNDVLVCITGGRTGAVGFVPRVPETAYINQHVCLIRPDTSKIIPKFLAQILYSEVGQLQFRLAQYGLKQGLGFSEVANVNIPCPPLDAQQSICSQIDLKSQLLKNTVEQVEASINRLQEFRSALITAAVTGQIDVATWGKKGQSERYLERIEG